MATLKKDRRIKLKFRIRKKVSGTNERPRLSVYRSNKHIFAQLIDDLTGVTIASASSLEKGIFEKSSEPKTDVAKLVGKSLAEKAKTAGIITAVFDRNGYLYHGRVKALADSARENGLTI